MIPAITPQGRFLLVLTIFALAMSRFFTSNHLLSFTASVLIAFTLVLLVWAFISARGLNVRREHSASAIEGSPLKVRLTVENPGRLARVNLVVFDIFTPAGRDDDRLMELPLAHLPAGGRRQLTYSAVPARRGEFELGPVYLAGGDPFGVFALLRRVEVMTPLTVFPSPLPIDLFPTHTPSPYPKDEAATIPREGFSPEFLGVREYRQGDPSKRIHWRLTAKRGNLIVTQRELNVVSSLNLVVVENFPPEPISDPRNDPLELAVKATTSLLHSAIRHDFECALMRLSPRGSELVRGSGDQVYRRGLHLLARIRGKGSFPVAPLTGETVGRLIPRAATIWLMAEPSEEDWQALTYLPVSFPHNLVLSFDLESFRLRRPATPPKVTAIGSVIVYRFGFGDDLGETLLRLAIQVGQGIKRRNYARLGRA